MSRFSNTKMCFTSFSWVLEIHWHCVIDYEIMSIVHAEHEDRIEDGDDT